MRKGFIILFLIGSILYGQSYELRGIIKESESGNRLSGANLFIKELELGATSNEFGTFLFRGIQAGNYTIIISYIGYETLNREITIKGNESELIFILTPQPVLLNESVITASRAEFRKTPVAFTQINDKDINQRLGSRDVVHVLESTPSVYISAQGGGTGDLRLNMRGFGQTNIGIMINGVPVNNPENGEVYWTNWAGVSDVVDYIQVQRGLGANPYSVSSIGGSINIVTRGIGKGDGHRNVRTEFGSENFRKFTISFAEELIPGKLSLNALVSKKSWNGYADRTVFDEFTYFLSLGGIYDNHSLEFQVMGSPQNHGQRLTMHSISFWKSHGKQFNSDWGYLNGTPMNIRDNVFHKPSVNLNHNWRISGKTILSNTVYFTYGDGGGTVPSWVEFSRTESGLVDLDSEWEKNRSTILPDVDPDLNYTANALRFTVHRHYWSGLISNIRYKSGRLDLSGGIDIRYYYAQNFRVVDNLLGGDYTLYSSDINLSPDTKLFIGDKVDYNADSYVRQIGGFTQAEYNLAPISIYAIASFSTTGYKRVDYFNYSPGDPNRETAWKDITGFTLKHGYNYNLDHQNNLYINAGYFSRAPLAENIYDYSNNEYQNIRNEKILNIEGGYNLRTNSLLLKLNGYYTTWKDKAIRTDVQDSESGQRYFYNISGANAQHTGIEFETKFAPVSNLVLNLMLSYALNKWTSNVNAVVAPESNPLQQKRINSYVKDVYVGGFPMTTASLSMLYSKKITEGTKFFFNPVYNFAGRHYSQYNPDQRTDPADEKVNSWRIPDFFLIDLHLGYEISTQNDFIEKIDIGLHVFNILDNNNYIIDAIDAEDHSSNSALVWYGRNRWWHASVKLDF